MEMLTTIAALGLVKLEAFAIALLDFGTLATPPTKGIADLEAWLKQK